MALFTPRALSWLPVLLAPSAPALAQVQLEAHKLVGSSAANLDYFGEALDLDGRTAVVGSTELSFPDFGHGSVYVFERLGGAWIETARLGATDGGPGQAFGRAVAIEGDTLLVGSDQDTPPGGAPAAGSVVVFERTPAGWERRARLLAADGDAGDLFGWSVDLDGGQALVGAWGDDGAAGAAYVFRRGAAGWVQESRLVAPDREPGDELGFAVALDGERALVGARGDRGAGGSPGAGSAYVFVRNATGWSREARLEAPAAGPGAQLGTSVDLDGQRAILGAPSAPPGGQIGGAAFVFVRSGGAWSPEATLTAAPGGDGFTFGRSVSLRARRALVGDPSGTDGGSVQVFERTLAGWVRGATLRASDGRDGQLFGQAVVLDRGRALVSAIFGEGLTPSSGAAYLFELVPGPGAR